MGLLDAYKDAFKMDDAKAAEWEQKFKEAVQPHLDEEVLAVGQFRRGGAAAQYAISKMQLGALAYGAASKVRKARAGGLPQRFLLAVTPKKVHVYKYKPARSGIKIQEEYTAWDRGSVTAKSKGGDSGASAVTLDVPEEGQTYKIASEGITGVKNPWAAAVVKLLENPKLQKA